MNISKLKEANKIYETLADMTVDQAISELSTYNDLDPEVFKLVKSLIINSDQSSEYFDQKVARHFKPQASNPWQPGMHIGGYELTEQIGMGGMSLVFKAKRVDSESQKPVAIKIFNIHNQTPAILNKFKAEQDILADLSHPHIVDFHHGQNTKQGDAFLVMELLEDGLSVDAYVQKNKLSPDAIIEFIRQAAQALQYAHSHLIIHRDVKPSNLMVDHNGQLKVLDFGIAKLISRDENNTRDHDTIMALTPSFAAPEQINAKPVGITADVYSLAAVAVLLLTEKQPFPSNRMLNACAQDEQHVSQILHQHLTDQDLINVLKKALRTSPELRYRSMTAFEEDLTAWLAQKPVSATPDSWWYRLRRFAVRRSALFATSLALGLTLVAAVIGLSLQNNAIKLEAKKAEAVKNFMLDAFSVTDPSYSQGVEISSKDLLRVAAEKIATDDGMDRAIKFELYLAMGLANGRLGYYSEAIQLLENALNIKPNDEQSTALLAQYMFGAGRIEEVNRLLSTIDESSFTAVNLQAMIKRVRANILAQAGKHQQALDVFKQLSALSNSTEDTIHNQALLAEIHYLNGNAAQSVQIIEQLKKDHPLAATDVTQLKLNSDLVQYHDQVGNYSAAMALTEKNIVAFKQILGDQHPDLGLAYNSLSLFQRLSGLLNEALESAKISEHTYRQRFGNSSEGLAQALSNIGLAHYFNNEPEMAIQNLTAAAEMLSQIFADDHPEAMDAKANLATILNAVGYPEKALPILQFIHEIENKTLGKSNRSVLYTKMSLALTLAKLEQFEPAINHAKETIQLIADHFPEEKDFINHAHSVLGRVYYMAGEHELAIEYNLIHIEKWTEGNENNYARSLQLITSSYIALESYDAAIEYGQKWTTHLAQIYGEKDPKHLQGLLDWAERLTSIGYSELAQDTLKYAQQIVKTHKIDNEQIMQRIMQLTTGSTDKLN